MDITTILILLTGICLIPSLIACTISDIKYRKAPAVYWHYTKYGGYITLIMYLTMLSFGEYGLVTTLAITSVVLAFTFYVMGMHFGAGGDYRALIYISLIAPVFILGTVLGSVVIGICQVAIHETFFKKNDTPWMISIVTSFIVTLAAFALFGKMIVI